MENTDETCFLANELQIDRSLIKHFNDAILEARGVPRYDRSSLLSQSKTLEIQLDEDPDYCMPGPDPAASELSEEVLEFYDPPPLATEVRPSVANDATIRHLSQFALKQFEIFLDPPSLGTMYNWEYLAARLGLTASEIMYLRTQRNPTSQVLFRFPSLSLNELLGIVCDLGRIDLLLSLREDVKGENSVVLACHFVTDSGVDDGTAPLTSTGTVCAERTNQALLHSQNTLKSRKCILVVHHEKKDNIELRKNYFWFMKNLRKYAVQEGVNLFDIDCCLDDSNLVGTINRIFVNAAHVIFVFAEDFLELLSSNTDHSLKKYIYDLSNGEYAQTLRNLRFRPIVFKDKGAVTLPIGWPTNTIVYEFPTMFSSLCTRIFK